MQKLINILEERVEKTNHYSRKEGLKEALEIVKEFYSKVIVDIAPEDIVKIRENLAMSQERFASFVGVSANTILKWEKGYVKPTKKDNLRMLNFLSTLTQEQYEYIRYDLKFNRSNLNTYYNNNTRKFNFYVRQFSENTEQDSELNNELNSGLNSDLDSELKNEKLNVRGR